MAVVYEVTQPNQQQKASPSFVPMMNTSGFLSNFTKFYGENEYYTGSDAHVFVNDMYLDEIAHITYTLSEQRAPIYGYNSYTWDDVAVGNRFVQGVIRVNYVYDDYLTDMIKNSTQLQKNMTSAKKIDILEKKIYPDLNAEQIMELIDNGKYYDIQSIIENKEAQIWGTGGTETVINKYRKPHFDNKYFDLIINFGEEGIITANSPYNSQKKATTVLNNVQLMTVSKVIAPSGEAIYEDYSFIAQDKNNTIGNKK